MSTDVANARRESLEESADSEIAPIISLPEVTVPTLEEEESVLHSARAKLFRLDSVEKEWKERGTGEAKLLYHKDNNTVRILMRRDGTLKVCANHYVTSEMILKPNVSSDRAWLWSTPADMTDGAPRQEILAIKFLNADSARRWKDKFEEAKEIVAKSENDDDVDKDSRSSNCSETSSESESDDSFVMVEKIKEMNLTETNEASLINNPSKEEDNSKGEIKEDMKENEVNKGTEK